MADPTYNAETVISRDHERIHSGRGYTASFFIPNFRNGDSINTLIRHPTRPVHLWHFKPYSERGVFRIAMLEGATVSAPGVVVPLVSNNRSITFDSGIQISHDPLLLFEGEELTSHDQDANAADGLFHEWIISPGRAMIVRVEKIAGPRRDLSVHMFCYINDN